MIMFFHIKSGQLRFPNARITKPNFYFRTGLNFCYINRISYDCVEALLEGLNFKYPPCPHIFDRFMIFRQSKSRTNSRKIRNCLFIIKNIYWVGASIKFLMEEFFFFFQELLIHPLCWERIKICFVRFFGLTLYLS